MTDLAVIMSVYHKDRSEFLKEAISSVLEQTFTDFHLFVAFDGPVSVEIINFFDTLYDSRIKLFRIEQNSGLANALNYLLENIIGKNGYKFIARMDADDVSVSDRFEKQRNFLLNNVDIACVGSWYEEIGEHGENVYFVRLPEDHESIKKMYLHKTPFAHSSVMFRKELIEKAGYYPADTYFMEDNVLWGRALKCGLRFANIPEYLHKFRINKDFFKRRRGIKYGLRYICTRFKIIRELNLPFYAYFISFAAGSVKMMPPVFLEIIYCLYRKWTSDRISVIK